MDDLGKGACMATAHVVLKVFDVRRKNVSVRDIKSWRRECVRTASLYYFHPGRDERYIRAHELRVQDAVVSLEQGEIPDWLEKAAAYIQYEVEEGRGPIAKLLAHT